MAEIIQLSSNQAVVSAEKEKLAHLLSDELDSALVESGLIPVDECVPYDRLAPAAKNAIQAAAGRIYEQLAYNAANGSICVIKHSQRL